LCYLKQEELKDTKEVIRIRKSKDRQQWPKETGQKNKQRSTKHTHKTRDKIRVVSRQRKFWQNISIILLSHD
jgi:hypothetical protein